MVSEPEISRWYDGYLVAFARCGRGEAEVGELLAFYDVPLFLSHDADADSLTSADAVAQTMGRYVAALREDGYQRSDEHERTVRAVNARTALVEAQFTRVRADDSVMARIVATYVVRGTEPGFRIAALMTSSAAQGGD